ncbi:MAG: type III-B CRISPR module-associated protein Cmr5 [Syntrophomonadaceae bacterium]|nr:type III-B CRISPR module-associated protein Cmr5 [Syntrophomonadaceae bacterium]
MKTLDQKRANNAWEVVKELEIKAESTPGQKDWNDLYTSYVSGLPAAIISCGIGQAAASLLSAAKGARDKPHYRLYKDLENWLCRDDGTAPYRRANSLMEAIIKNDREQYMWAQAEALAWLEWLKKFTVAYLKKPDPAKGGEG